MALNLVGLPLLFVAKYLHHIKVLVIIWLILFVVFLFQWVLNVPEHLESVQKHELLLSLLLWLLSAATLLLIEELLTQQLAVGFVYKVDELSRKEAKRGPLEGNGAGVPEIDELFVGHG